MAKTKNYNIRRPNLSTILMVENVLRKNKTKVLKVSELKKLLPKQIMHPTLKIILEYLWESRKIDYSPAGVQWIFLEKDDMKKMIKRLMQK